MGFFARGFPEGLRQAIENHPKTYNAMLDIIKKEKEINERNIVFIQPDSKIAASTLNNSRENLSRSIQQGYADACRHGELNSFGK
jgi:predicted patatin/cPLA2 family phospholipase